MIDEFDSKLAEFANRYWLDNSSLPKHEILRKAIVRAVIEGFWQPGARLPSERDLITALPCSLGTVQRTLRQLVADGVIMRKRGSGTIVADRAYPLDEPWHMRFIDIADGAQHRFYKVFTHVISRRVISKTGQWSAPLLQDQRKVVRIERIMQVADEIDIYAVFYAIAEKFPELVSLSTSELNGTDIKRLIGSQPETLVQSVQQTLRFETLPANVRKQCRWPGNTIAAVVNALAFSEVGEPLYYQDFYVPPNKLTLDLGVTTRS